MTSPIPQQSPHGKRRDAVARAYLDYLKHEDPRFHRRIIRAGTYLLLIPNFGESSLAELLFALGMAGVLDKLGAKGEEERPIVWPVETRGEGSEPVVYLNGKHEVKDE